MSAWPLGSSARGAAPLTSPSARCVAAPSSAASLGPAPAAASSPCPPCGWAGAPGPLLVDASATTTTSPSGASGGSASAWPDTWSPAPTRTPTTTAGCALPSAPEMRWRHWGHVASCLSHLWMHSAWKTWRHGRRTTSSSSSNSQRQTTQLTLASNERSSSAPPGASTPSPHSGSRSAPAGAPAGAACDALEPASACDLALSAGADFPPSPPRPPSVSNSSLREPHLNTGSAEMVSSPAPRAVLPSTTAWPPPCAPCAPVR
mmetsp:Transcript_2843/g.8189  ORF Transcript_2843/g.8189 Transcript_2843/m.8189 type:complete len:261 (+) Transcript_2843:530-1312(+)